MPFPKSRTIFVSGSAYEYGRFGDYGKLFIRQLSARLLNNGFKLISGFGLGVGNHVVDGAVADLHKRRKEELSDYLQVFPFPGAASQPSESIRRYYRNYMLSKAGIVIFLFGNKLEDIAIKEADGMWEEFEQASANKALLIPVGISGYTSEKIWEHILFRYDEYFGSRDYYPLFQQLGDPFMHPEQLLETIIRLANQNEEKKGIHQF